MRRSGYALTIACCLGIAVFLVAYPLYVIQPFRPQAARELAAALTVLRFRWLPMALCAALALAALVGYWRSQPSTWRRVLAVLGVIGVVGFGVLSRINIYELMFHPIGRPAFVAASETKLDGDEMVIAIEVGGTARAYPIRVISYHHIVNDVLDGVPIVATY
jgi:hypothetical protein